MEHISLFMLPQITPSTPQTLGTSDLRMALVNLISEILTPSKTKSQSLSILRAGNLSVKPEIKHVIFLPEQQLQLVLLSES